MSSYLTYAELVELHERIAQHRDVIVAPEQLEALQRAHVRAERHGITPGGIEWRSYR